MDLKLVPADVKSILNDDDVYHEAALEAFSLYNKSHMISLEMPDRSGDVCTDENLSKHKSRHFLRVLYVPSINAFTCFYSNVIISF